MAKVDLEGQQVIASDCCGINVLYKLGDISVENGNPEKNAPAYCAKCQKQCTPISYILVRKENLVMTTETKISYKK